MRKQQIKEALSVAGAENRYQQVLTILLSLLWSVMNFVLLGPTLIYMDPEFICHSTGPYTRVTQTQACPMINSCRVADDFTIVAELQLYCDREWERDMIQSVFSIGAFLGLIIMNLISDTKGRKYSVGISILVMNAGVVCTLLGACLQLSFFLMISQFLGGFGSYSLVTLTYILLSDFCSDGFRPKAIVAVNSAWGLSTFLLGVFYIVELGWLYYLLFCVLVPLALVSACLYKFIVESPYILATQGREQQALANINSIAKFNARSHAIDQIEKILQQQESNPQEQEVGMAKKQITLKSLFSIVKQWKYLKEIALLTVIYATGNMNFYGVSYAFGTQGYGFGFNSMLAGLIEATSILYLNSLVSVLPRRKGIPAVYGVSLVLGMLFLIDFIADDQIVQTCLLGASRIFSTIGYTLIACAQVEAFPVEIQSTAAGLIEAFSLAGVLIAPLIVDLSDKIGVNPVVSISVMINFAIWPSYFLRQTLVVPGKKPHKGQEAQNDGEKHQESLLTESLIDSDSEAPPKRSLND